jgi:hypothetical protein
MISKNIRGFNANTLMSLYNRQMSAGVGGEEIRQILRTWIK